MIVVFQDYSELLLVNCVLLMLWCCSSSELGDSFRITSVCICIQRLFRLVFRSSWHTQMKNLHKKKTRASCLLHGPSQPFHSPSLMREQGSGVPGFAVQYIGEGTRESPVPGVGRVCWSVHFELNKTCVWKPRSPT